MGWHCNQCARPFMLQAVPPARPLLAYKDVPSKLCVQTVCQEVDVTAYSRATVEKQRPKHAVRVDAEPAFACLLVCVCLKHLATRPVMQGGHKTGSDGEAKVADRIVNNALHLFIQQLQQ